MSVGLVYDLKLNGSCLCGGVSYRVNGLLRGVVNCFCRQCRKTSGHYVAATRADWASVDLTRSASLKWYVSSPGVRRGFCGVCGGNLFWDNGRNNEVSIMAGTLDSPTHLETVANIHEQAANDYHHLPSLTV